MFSTDPEFGMWAHLKSRIEHNTDPTRGNFAEEARDNRRRKAEQAEIASDRERQRSEGGVL
ncbi:hypothetical protein SISSUDRAFT_1055655, partial [Sistotremastrum suecicum HHB10207 ss-3]